MGNDKSVIAPGVGDIFSTYKHLLPYATDREWKVINAITACRTEKLGGNIRRCEHCRHTEINYFSCRDRHCPQCGALQKEAWVLKRNQELLPVSYFHLVFTVPHEFLPLFRLNRKFCYSLLFDAVAKTIKVAAGNPDNLGVDAIGFFLILHTWDQKLNYHPHIHCVIPGGGLSADKARWISSDKSFFIPVRRLSAVFRGVFCKLLETRFAKEPFSMEVQNVHETGRQALQRLLVAACKKNWVVYAKPPFNGPYWVVRYLSAYTHRIAISNYRIVSADNGFVVFSYKDRKDGCKPKQCRLPALDFMRRFLQHVLPPGFVRIRHYGFLGNVCRRESIKLIYALLGATKRDADPVPTSARELYMLVTRKNPDICSVCGEPAMVVFASLPPPFAARAG